MKYWQTPKWKLMMADYQLRRKYGITLREKQDLFDSQNGVCAIEGCGYEFKDLTDANTDHNHTTGNVRGLLCTKCNMMVGSLEYFAEQLPALMEHIKREGFAGVNFPKRKRL